MLIEMVCLWVVNVVGGVVDVSCVINNVGVKFS